MTKKNTAVVAFKGTCQKHSAKLKFSTKMSLKLNQKHSWDGTFVLIMIYAFDKPKWFITRQAWFAWLSAIFNSSDYHSRKVKMECLLLLLSINCCLTVNWDDLELFWRICKDRKFVAIIESILLGHRFMKNQEGFIIGIHHNELVLYCCW